MEFHAKHIQKIVGIPKYRYEYLANKMNINPDVAEGEGQGKVHKYSFRNLLQFAFVHNASGLGLTPKASREFLSHLDKIDQDPKRELSIFDPDVLADISVHYVIDKNSKYFSTSFALGDEKNRMILSESGEDYDIPFQEATYLYYTLGFVTINLGNLKKRILGKV